MNNYSFLDELKNKIVKFVYNEKYNNYKHENLDHNKCIFRIDDEEFEINDFVVFVTFNVEIRTNTDDGNYYIPTYTHVVSEHVTIESIIYYEDEETEYKVPYKIIKIFENDINNALR